MLYPIYIDIVVSCVSVFAIYAHAVKGKKSVEMIFQRGMSAKLKKLELHGSTQTCVACHHFGRLFL